jgi:hypothetical protein
MSDTKLVGKAPEVRSVSDAVPPNKTQSSTSFTRITRTISPKYLPLIYFSNLKKKKKTNNKLHLWEKVQFKGYNRPTIFCAQWVVQQMRVGWRAGIQRLKTGTFG